MLKDFQRGSLVDWNTYASDFEFRIKELTVIMKSIVCSVGLQASESTVAELEFGHGLQGHCAVLCSCSYG